MEKFLKTDNQLTVSTLRQGLESLGAGEMADAVIAGYLLKRLKDITEASSKEQAAAELEKFSNELKADEKTAELAKIADFFLLCMALNKE